MALLMVPHRLAGVPARGWSRPGAIARWVIAILAVLVALISYRYLFGVPPVPPNIAANRYRTVWLAMHAGFAATALLVGAVQFSRRVRQGRPAIHRAVGRIYAASCLVGGAAGFVLALGSQAGPVATAGFAGLAVAWMVTTGLGVQRARTRRFAAHRRWMIRSWALTLSAVTLRIYLPLAEVAGLPEMAAYRAISFLAWAPNLIVAEALLRLQRSATA